MLMDENGPLSYFNAGDVEREEFERGGDRRMLAVVLALGFGLLLAVFVLPEVVRSSAGRSLPPRPVPPANTGVVRVLVSLEAYQDANGMYPATLAELDPATRAELPDEKNWRYSASPDGTEYQLHYVGGKASTTKRASAGQ